ncbi:metal-sensitive transcriptional regulator [Streptomyces sp. NPDC006385]|uniref:metal-sensitive transcriptional regulator n=1 Tax=Streptomyces sp. NPDC006385 TaxID=3156761 RepID=UPI0033BA2207
MDGTEFTRGPLTGDAADDVLRRLARVSGQVQGISRMVREGRHCVEVLDQLASAQKALDAASRQVVRHYLEHTVAEAATDGGNDPRIFDELMTVLFRHR